MRDPVDGDLLLGHRLEQCGLRLRRRAVDLVDEDDVREDRPRTELEVPRLLVEDREPGDVGRLEVRRALDALGHGALDAPRDRSGENGLRRARDVLEEDVPVARERCQDELDLVALSVDDRLDVVHEPVGDRTGTLEALRLGRSGENRLHGRDGSCGYVRQRARHAATRVLLRTPRTLVRSRRGEACLALEHYVNASAPATTSRISWVISAWRARFMLSVSESMSSPAFFEALRIAVIRAPCSDAVDSSSAR